MMSDGERPAAESSSTKSNGSSSDRDMFYIVLGMVVTALMTAAAPLLYTLGPVKSLSEY